MQSEISKPARSAPINAAAPLLASALRDLGGATSELIASLPKLEACSPSLLEESLMVSSSSRLLLKASTPIVDAVDAAVAAIAEESTNAVEAVLEAATSALAPYEQM